MAALLHEPPVEPDCTVAGGMMLVGLGDLHVKLSLKLIFVA